MGAKTKYDLTNLDKLNALLGNSISNPQREDLVKIEANPLYHLKDDQIEAKTSTSKDGLVLKPVKPKESNIGKAYRENTNDPLNLSKDYANEKSMLATSVNQDLDKSEANLSNLAEELKGKVGSFEVEKIKPSFDSSSFLKKLEGQLESMDRPQKDISMLEGLVKYGLPTLLSYAGGVPQAGLNYLETANKMDKDVLDRQKEEKKARIDSIGKQLQGAGELRKADVEAQKQSFEEAKTREESDYKKYNLIKEISQNLFDKKMISKDKAEQMLFDAQKLYVDKYMGGAGKYADVESGLEKSKMGIEAAKQRALTPKQQRPTEFNLKSAETYRNLLNANSDISQLVKETGGFYPSQLSDLPKTEARYLGSFAENTAMGTILSDMLKKGKIDKNLERQIMKELRFIAPIARKESGAAVSVGEWLSYGEMFFPRGKNMTVNDISQLERAREQYIENAKTSAGEAVIPKEIPLKQKQGKDATLTYEQSEKIKKGISEKLMEVNGKRYRKTNNGWQEVK